MSDWWTDMEEDVLVCLKETGAVGPVEVGRRLGLSEAAATSLLSLLAQEGKVRICLVSLPWRGDGALRPDPPRDEPAYSAGRVSAS